ncbi:DUF3341 domain-containing protein [bacterium]|nr:DUF3341 domain-containing protein [bacterium]
MAISVIGEFKDPTELLRAAKKTNKAGYKTFDAHSPFPIHGMDDAMDLKGSVLGWIVLCGGLTGCVAGFGLQAWVATEAYPLVISGKPLFSYQAFVPVTFEVTVLFAAFAAVFGMFGLNKLPQLYNRLFKHRDFSKKAASHGFFVSIASELDSDEASIVDFLKSIGATNVSGVKE